MVIKLGSLHFLKFGKQNYPNTHDCWLIKENLFKIDMFTLLWQLGITRPLRDPHLA